MDEYFRFFFKATFIINTNYNINNTLFGLQFKVNKICFQDIPLKNSATNTIDTFILHKTKQAANKIDYFL